MLRFVMTGGHEYTLDEVLRDRRAPRCEIVSYDRLFAAARLPRAVYVFTDLDRLGGWDLELAGAAHRALVRAGVPTLNDPARVRKRYGLLRALHEAGINQFNAYRVEEGIRPARYPVFLRREVGHRAPQSGLLDDWNATRRAIDATAEQGIPLGEVLIIEYAAEPARPGVFRKLSLARVGDRYTPMHCVHQNTWLVKQGSDHTGPLDLFEDELRIMRENPYAEALAPAFEIARIDYGRADFGLVGGRVQIYEINTNPKVAYGSEHPIALRNESQRLAWEKMLDALRALDERPVGRGPVRIADKRLARYQGRPWRPARSRFVP